jgi:hypothetical protein
MTLESIPGRTSRATTKATINVGETNKSKRIASSQKFITHTPEQLNDRGSETYTSKKIVQVNHFGVYWNSIIEMEKFGDTVATASSYQNYKIPTPYAVLCGIKTQDEIFEAMNLCISRRSGNIIDNEYASSFTPTYIIQPIDATCRVVLSKDPRNCQYVPVVEVSVIVDSVDLEIRRNHYHQILKFLSMLKNHSYSRKFWIYRPSESVKENPQAWWKYVLTVVKLQLKDRHAWSWTRLEQTSALRRRYCFLYKRKLISNYQSSSKVKSSFSSLGELSSEENADLNEQDGSTSLIEPLSTQELQELESMDDGSLGFLSIEDIISIRAAIKYKIAEMVRSNEQNLFEHKKEKQSYLSYLKTFISEDDHVCVFIY